MNKITKVVMVVVIFFAVISLVYFGFRMKELVFAQDLSSKQIVQKSESETTVRLLLEDKDPQTGQPKVVVEWGRVWGGLWDKEAKELKAQGLSEEGIINTLNPEAAKRVAKNLGVEKAEDVQQAVDEYFTSLSKSESQSQ